MEDRKSADGEKKRVRLIIWKGQFRELRLVCSTGKLGFRIGDKDFSFSRGGIRNWNDP